jgi:hypothetical protein
MDAYRVFTSLNPAIEDLAVGRTAVYSAVERFVPAAVGEARCESIRVWGS